MRPPRARYRPTERLSAQFRWRRSDSRPIESRVKACSQQRPLRQDSWDHDRTATKGAERREHGQIRTSIQGSRSRAAVATGGCFGAGGLARDRRRGVDPGALACGGHPSPGRARGDRRRRAAEPREPAARIKALERGLRRMERRCQTATVDQRPFLVAGQTESAGAARGGQ